MDDRLPPNYPQGHSMVIRIKDDYPVLIRPILPEDRTAMERAFRMLSPQTIYFRFMEYVDDMPPERWKYLTEIDYETQFALVAVPQVGLQDEIVAAGRFVRTQDPEEAELALIVRDEYQHRGIGRQLACRLAAIAAGKGIRRFVGEVLSDNIHALQFVDRLPFPVEKHFTSGICEVRIDIQAVPAESV